MKKYIVASVVLSTLLMANISHAEYGCEVDLVANKNTCSGIVPITLVSQENQMALVKINLSPKVVLPGAKIRFDVSFRGDISPDGWNVDIGDSDTNNGYAGDDSTSANDAEMQILSNRQQGVYDFGVFGNDQTPASHTTDGNRFLKNIFHKPLLTGKTVSFIVGDEYLKYDLSATDPMYVDEMKTSDLYALNGQVDNQGPVNYDLYAGFNRVISGPGERIGSGVGKVKITIIEKETKKSLPVKAILGKAVSTRTSILEIQQKLSTLKHYSGPITGIANGETVAAIKEFQKRNRLKADGVIGVKTLAVLRAKDQAIKAYKPQWQPSSATSSSTSTSWGATSSTTTSTGSSTGSSSSTASGSSSSTGSSSSSTSASGTSSGSSTSPRQGTYQRAKDVLVDKILRW